MKDKEYNQKINELKNDFEIKLKEQLAHSEQITQENIVLKSKRKLGYRIKQSSYPV